jgi:hypothetical protein
MKASWFESREKITLYHDPRYRGADIPPGIENRPADMDVPLSQLYGFEPDDKMSAKEHGDQLLKIALKMKAGTWKGKPIIVTKTTKGYMILDGHHRFAAAKKAGMDSLPAIVVDRDNIENSNHVPDDLKEASGYIPTAAQANDPRFKTALTVDVRPGEDQRNIKKLGLDLNQELVRKTSPNRKNKNSVHTLQNLGLAESLALDYQIMKEADLFEVSMSPGALRDWARSKRHCCRL